jgi:protoheme IX farnesyltransferase
MRFIRTLAELGKIKITLSVAFSAFTGYLLARGTVDTAFILPVLGIFFLACGASALNQYQERKADALMVRTRGRPLPSGRISPAGALLVACAYAVTGSLMLFFSAGLTALLLGLLALVWYNGLYTPLKRITPFAVLPGAVIGAIPPAVGWVAGGGGLTDMGIVLIAFFFFIWQVPHFWLLLLQYDDEYEKAGYPTLTKIFSLAQIRRMTFSWIVAMALTSLLVVFYGIISSAIMIVILFITCLVMIWSFRDLLRPGEKQFRVRPAFIKINVFFLLVLMYIWIDQFI